MSRAALCALLLVGCGGSCPEPTTTVNDNRDPDEPTPERPSPASVGAFAGFDGRWYLVEPDDDEVEVVIEIQGETGRLWESQPEEAVPATLERRPDGLVSITFSAPGRAPERVFLVPRGPHSITAFQLGDDDALIGRREGPLPAFLQGRWELASLRDSRTMELEVEGAIGRVIRDGEARPIRLAGLMREGPTHDLAVQVVAAGSSEMNWLRLSEVSPGVYLLREGNDEEFRVMYRPGAAPAWLAEARRRDAPPPSATEASPEIR